MFVCISDRQTFNIYEILKTEAPMFKIFRIVGVFFHEMDDCTNTREINQSVCSKYIKSCLCVWICFALSNIKMAK